MRRESERTKGSGEGRSSDASQPPSPGGQEPRRGGAARRRRGDAERPRPTRPRDRGRGRRDGRRGHEAADEAERDATEAADEPEAEPPRSWSRTTPRTSCSSWPTRPASSVAKSADQGRDRRGHRGGDRLRRRAGRAPHEGRAASSWPRRPASRWPRAGRSPRSPRRSWLHERTTDGTEGQPLRVPTRGHHRLEVALVRRPRGVRRLHHRGLEDPGLPDGRAAARRHQPGRGRAHARPPAHRRPHRPPRHRHRPPRRRGRPPARRPDQDHRQRQGPAQHPGDQAARARRRADRPGRRRPARRPGRLPPGHEAGRAERPEGRCPGHPGPVLGSPRRLRDGPHRVVPRGSGAAAHAAGRHRLRLPRGPHHRRPHRREGLDLQGRHPPLQARQRGEERPRGGHGRRRDLRPGRARRPGSCPPRPPASARRRRPRRKRPPPRPPRPRPRPTEDAPEPLIKEADPEFERLLAEEEEIERTTREHHETPHFRPGDAD